MIRALIVDDEPLARRGIRSRLEREADLEILGEAEDGPQATEAILTLEPDLLFLDVQMPGYDGFEVLERARAALPRAVVFTTAYDAHAIRAFELNALDYLLKPYSDERFAECLRRARYELAHPEPGGAGSLDHLMSYLDTGRRPVERLWVRDGDRIVMVRTADLYAVEAAGNYVMLVEAARKLLLRLTLAQMEEQLDPARFARIHRSTLVQVDRVREVRPDAHGDCDVLLENGSTYRLSRSYRERLLPGGRGES